MLKKAHLHRDALWSRRWESNPRPTVYDTVALPSELQRRAKWALRAGMSIVVGVLLGTIGHAHAEIYDVTLSEHNLIQLFRQHSFVALESVSGHRTHAFLEVIPDADGRATVTVLPRSLIARFTLTDTRPLSERRHWTASSATTSIPLVMISSTETSTRYFIEATSFTISSQSEPIATNEVEAAQGGVNRANAAFFFMKDPLVPILPTGLQLVTPLYTLDYRQSAIDSVPFRIKIPYTDSAGMSRALYAYDPVGHSWKALESYNDVEARVLTGTLTAPVRYVGILGSEQARDGIASWYSFKRCLCAASTIYPKGATVRVTRLKSNKSVTVRINDYGPEPWTGRLIDLDAYAFKVIGALRAGLIYVKTELIRTP